MHKDYIPTHNIKDMQSLIQNVRYSGDKDIINTFKALLKETGITNLKKTTLEEFIEKSYHTDNALLREFLEMLKIRFCKSCGHAFIDGYMDGTDYYCEGKNCLPYSEDDWAERCEENEDDCYWSEWEGSPVIVALYNKVAFGDKA